MKKALTFENWVSVLFMIIAIIASIYYFNVGEMEDNVAAVIYNGVMTTVRIVALILISAKTIFD